MLLLIVTIVGLFSLISSCSSPVNTTVDGAIADSIAIKIANQLFQKFNVHDWAGMAALYTDTADFKDPSLGTGIVKQSRQQTVDKYTKLNDVIKDIKDSVIAIYPSNKKIVVAEFISKGTTPDGNKFELPICTILTINDKGLIEKDYTYYDNSGNNLVIPNIKESACFQSLNSIIYIGSNKLNIALCNEQSYKACQPSAKAQP